jgi:exonuclease III
MTTICCSDSSDKSIFGTGFLVHKKLKSSIMDFIPVDERTCCLRLRGKFFNTTLICINAPTEEEEDTEKNSFYDKLDHVYQKAPTHDIKIIMGDMNVKVGKDMRAHNVGRYSLHEVSNDNGTRLIDFAISRNMVINIVRYLIRTFTKKPVYPLMVIQKIGLTMC